MSEFTKGDIVYPSRDDTGSLYRVGDSCCSCCTSFVPAGWGHYCLERNAMHDRRAALGMPILIDSDPARDGAWPYDPVFQDIGPIPMLKVEWDEPAEDDPWADERRRYKLNEAFFRDPQIARWRLPWWRRAWASIATAAAVAWRRLVG